MPQLSEDEARAILGPFHGRLASVVHAAFSEWMDIDACRAKKGHSPFLYPRTGANVIFDAIARRAISELVDVTGVRVIHEPQTVKFCFDNQVVVRFKKANSDGLGQNIPTQAAIDFTDPQASLPGIPNEASKVEIVWEADELMLEVKSVTILARNGDAIVWAYPIEPDSNAGVLQFPSDPGPDDDGSAADLVTLRPVARPAFNPED